MPKLRRLIFSFDQVHRIWKLDLVAGTELAVLLPTALAAPQSIQACDELAALQRVRKISITVIGGHPELRAAAVMNGLRASTSVAEWEEWLTETEIQAFRQERRQRLQSDNQWRVLHFAPPHESQPEFVAALSRHAGIPTSAERAIPADERYETAIVAAITTTGGYTVDEYQANLG